jgi:hypothetical protein
MASKWPSISLRDAADGLEMARHFIGGRRRWPRNGPAFHWGTVPMVSKRLNMLLVNAADGVEMAQHFIERCRRWP